MITDEYVTLALQRAVRQYALDASLAREAALQERLNLADQRIDELETELHQLRTERKAA